MLWLRKILDGISLLLAPPYCSACRAWMLERVPLCVDCDGQILPIVAHALPITPALLLPVFAIADYQAPLRQLILAKHRSDRLSARQLGELIWQKTAVSQLEFDIIVPIPLHWTRRMRRGYNQAQEIATVLGAFSNKPVLTLLQRNKRTAFQSLLSRVQRAQNVKDVFICATAHSASLYRNKRILIVDDLMTSGATLQAAVKPLLKLEPAALYAAVACRVV